MTNALIPTIEDAADFTVIANSPAEMEAAQKSLIKWAARKVQSLFGELVVAKAQYNLAQENGWSTYGWGSQITKLTRRADFYGKIKAALEAGYYIVPPFPVDTFAIRVKRARPSTKQNSTNHRSLAQQAQMLPEGEGRYVSPTPVVDSFIDQEKNYDGKMKEVVRYYPTDYSDVEFPFKLARAEIMEATDKALQRRIFDRLGILPAPRRRHPDPIVCGQILFPDQTLTRWGEPRCVTFFVTWWLDTSTL